MKKYHVAQPYGKDPLNTTVIYNDDENPIITSIYFRSYTEVTDKNQFFRGISIKFRDESKEIKQKFNETPQAHSEMMGFGTLINQKTMDNIIEFLTVVQEIDPVPISAFLEVSALINYDFSGFINHNTIEDLVNKGAHQAALQEALQATLKGDADVLTQLVNLYERNQDQENYLNVLEHIPKDHPSFIEANEMIHAQLMLISTPKDEEQRYNLLERKFRSALNSEQINLAGHYFDELCGNSGLKPVIADIIGDPDTLIKIAKQQRVMQKELQELKDYKAAQEKINKELQDKSMVTSLGIFSASKEREPNPGNQIQNGDEFIDKKMD